MSNAAETLRRLAVTRFNHEPLGLATDQCQHCRTYGDPEFFDDECAVRLRREIERSRHADRRAEIAERVSRFPQALPRVVRVVRVSGQGEFYNVVVDNPDRVCGFDCIVNMVDATTAEFIAHVGDDVRWLLQRLDEVERG